MRSKHGCEVRLLPASKMTFIIDDKNVLPPTVPQQTVSPQTNLPRKILPYNISSADDSTTSFFLN